MELPSIKWIISVMFLSTTNRNNLHGVWAHCAAAKTSDGNKFKNATSARKDHIGVSILLQLKLRNTPYQVYFFIFVSK